MLSLILITINILGHFRSLDRNAGNDILKQKPSGWGKVMFAELSIAGFILFVYYLFLCFVLFLLVCLWEEGTKRKN